MPAERVDFIAKRRGYKFMKAVDDLHPAGRHREGRVC